MTIVAVHACAETSGGKGEAGFADERRAVIAVSIAPDTVELNGVSRPKSCIGRNRTHHLVPTDNGYYAQRLDTHTPRIKRRTAIITLVAQNHVGMDVRVQILDAITRRCLDFALPARLALRVSRFAAAAIDGVGQVAITVDVHVRELV